MPEPIPTRRCYTIPVLLALLDMSRSTFDRKRAAQQLPFLEELLPRIGRPRFRADLVDRYLAGRGVVINGSFADRRRRA